jgi:hypothetical protein
VARLEDRTLLSGPSGDVLAAVAPKIELGTSRTGTLAPGEVVFFQIDPTTDGRLRVHAEGATTQLSLLDVQGQVLMQSDGPSPDDPDQIDLHVSAGTDYLEVENLSGTGAYTLTATLTPASTPFQPITLSTGINPGAIVAGDFNGDGRTDLAVANQGSNDVSVLLGNGDGTFQKPLQYAVGIGPSALVAGDFRGDGRTDLAVANTLSNDVSVLLGNGDGTFQNQVRYAAGLGPSALVAGDFSDHGRTDLAVANASSNDVSVLLGNGDGTFQNQVRYAAGTEPNALVAGDFRGDGHTDLAVANTASGDVSVLLGNGDGTFQNQVRYGAGAYPMSIVAGDFSGDGRTDLAVANGGSNDVSVLLGNGDGTFQNQVRYGAGAYPMSIVAGDFRGDGRTDLAVANHDSNDVSVLLGNGDGTFQKPVQYAAGTVAYALVAGDFRGDGRTDLAVANYFSNDVSVLLGNGDGTFQNQVRYAVGTDPTSIVAGDFNGDGRADLAIANAASGDVSVLLGNGDGTFQNQVRYAAGYRPSALVAGDFRGDGHTDLAVANQGSNDVSVLLGNGDGTFQNQVTYAVGSEPYALVAGDFTGDGRTDLAVANAGSNDASVLLGNGDGTFQNQVRYAVGTEPSALVVGDFTGDGRTDLAVANAGSNDVSVLLGNGDGTFQNQVRYAVGTEPSALVVGDFTGDGRTDLAVANAGSNDVSVLLSNGDGTFQNQVRYAAGSGPSALVAGDFSGDGRTDLAVANYGSGDVSVLLGNGNGTFGDQVRYAAGTEPSALVAGDFTGDGRTDLAVANFLSNDVSVLLGNGDGTFQGQVPYAAGAFPMSVVAGDFNGDGRTDLAVANAGSNDVSVLLGNGDGTFQDQVPYAAGSDPTSIVAGDFNGDGRTDLAVANAGSNDVSVLLGNGDGSFQNQKTYRVGNEPVAIVAGDFTDDGRIDLAVANAGSNDVSVLLGNGDGTFQNQVQYAAGDGPSALVAGDFSGNGRTDLAVANHDSGDVSVLLGNGDGTFQNQVRYAAGFGPIALVAGHFTGDGHTDLAVANQGSNDVSVLLGNGDGTFQNQVQYAAGFVPYALVAGDFTGDGRTDLAVANDFSNDVSVLLGNGDGTFRDQVRYAAGFGPSALVAGDFTGGGRTDLAVANDGSNDVSVLLNLNGTFAAPGPFAINPHATPLVTDLSGDGADDVMVINGAGDILWRKGRPQEPGTFDPPIKINPGYPSRDIVAVDTNQGRVLASVDATDNAISLYAWHDGNFVRIGSLSTGSLPAQIVTADLNGDGWDDLVVRNAGDGTLTVFFSNDSGSDATGNALFPSSVTLPVGLGVSDVTLADVDRDGAMDIIVTNKVSGEVGILRNLYGFDLRLMSSVNDVSDMPTDGKNLIIVADVQNVLHFRIFDADGKRVVDTDENQLPDKAPQIAELKSLLSDLWGVPPLSQSDKDRVITAVTSIVGPAVYYRAGGGLYGVTNNSDGSATLTTLEATSGVAAGAFTQGSPPDLLTVNPGSNTLGLLAGLGAGRFANPVNILTAEPAQVVRVADFNHDGIPDVAVLGKDTVSIYLGNGRGGFSAPVSYNAGLDPTGLTVADLGHDGDLDLLIGNAYGDVLVLAGQGDGTFRPLLDAGQNVALAVADLTGNGTKDIIYASQNLDNVVVDYGGGQRISVGASSGLLAPGAVAVADLNGDGKPYLIVANSGGNNVLVYPGLGNGRFGPELNGGKGFFTGTDPVGVTVADLGNGRLDLVVADRGSNDVTILLNQATADGGFTFVPGPRLNLKTATQQGIGPVATAIVPSPTGGPPRSLAVSVSGSNQVWVIPSVGGGFFNDQNPTIFDVGSNPGPILVGNFTRPGQLDLVTVNAGSNDLTLIPDFLHGGQPREISSGGTDPVAAFEFSSGSGFDNLVVANNGDGTFALLEGGPDGLNLTSTETAPGLLNPTDLAFLAFTGGQVQFYAATEGSETATLLTFQLGLQPLRDAALPLIATLLTLTIETSTAELNPGAFEGEAAAAVSFLPVSTVTVGQSLSEHAGTGEGENGDEEEPNEPKEPDLPVAQESSSWQPFLMGLDEALDQFCHDSLDQFMSRDKPAPDKAQPPHALSKPLNLLQPDQASPEAHGAIGTDSNHLPQANQGQIIDEAIRSLWADESRPVRTSLTPTSVPLTSDGTTPAETAPADATLLSPEPVQRQDGPLLSSHERGFEALTEFAVSLLLAAFVARRIDPPSTRHCTPTNPFSSLRLLRRPLSRFR